MMSHFTSALLPCFVCFAFMSMAPKKDGKATAKAQPKESAAQKRKREAVEQEDKDEKKRQQALMKTSLSKSSNPDAKALLTVYESLDRFSTEKTALLQRWLQELKSFSITIIQLLVCCHNCFAIR